MNKKDKPLRKVRNRKIERNALRKEVGNKRMQIYWQDRQYQVHKEALEVFKEELGSEAEYMLKLLTGRTEEGTFLQPVSDMLKYVRKYFTKKKVYTDYRKYRKVA